MGEVGTPENLFRPLLENDKCAPSAGSSFWMERLREEMEEVVLEFVVCRLNFIK